MSSSKDCFIIAEIGVNHNGDMDIARQLISAAAQAGADAAKFQTFRAQDMIVKGTKTVAYQNKNANVDDQYQLLKNLELRFEQHQGLIEHCRENGIAFMSTGFDIASLEFLLEAGVERLKIPSGEITNTPLVVRCAESLLPVIVSTGMADLAEVQSCVEVIEAVWQEKGHTGDLTLLHCTTSYPTQDGDVNLAAMQTMAQEFNKPVGYSDHTKGIFVPPLAVAAGACVIEKHITLDRKMEGPDHAASIEPQELADMVSQIRRVQTILGDGEKAPKEVELEARALVRKGLKFSRELPAGHKIEEADLVVLRPETGARPALLGSFIGKYLKNDVNAFDPVEEGNIR